MPKNTRSTRATRATTRKCTAVRGCQNNALPGRRTCGQHGHRHSATATTPIHLDRVLRTWRDYETDTAPLGLAIETTRLPEETPYLAGIAVRDNGTILGLPTTRAGFQNFLSAWLTRPGRSLADIELLTPPTLPGRDISVAICDAAARMVRYDLSQAVSNA